ncbi:acyltransferase domain-containing protein [Thermoactinospora rubra]|uniref:acyltransferase domain-containing protein n=1 Tax=Thermoactinospora rubra TaxID=1088767 RepID=UPI000A103DC1|nr:acyltransferase domain-containing protein [Thermoactinospora rubra]
MDLACLTAEELLKLAVPHEDIAPLLAGRPAPGSDAWRRLQQDAGDLLARMGRADSGPRPPEEATAEFGPYYYVYVFLALLPHVRAYHREHGIPAEVSWFTLTDLGRHMAVHRRLHGRPGLNAVWWHTLHFRGLLYALGRLQFERAPLGEAMAGLARSAGIDAEAGEPVLSVHIPDFLGPMTPEACEESFRRAREFFPRHFPEDFPDGKVRLAVCDSWLLDGRLAAHLPRGSNIVAFQRRFVTGNPRPDRDGILPFVYGTAEPPAVPPRRTSLERAVATLLDGGAVPCWTMGVTRL